MRDDTLPEYGGPMRHTSLLLLALAGCDDTTFPTPPGAELPTGAAGQGWCGVQATFANECAACHSEGGGIGGLDLVTDPHAAIVGVESDRFPGKTIVLPGDPEGSLLYRKITGTQASDEGTPMPPGQTVDAAVAEVFRAWIADGADDVCDGGGGGGTGGGQGVHPEGWALPTVHGLETKLGTGGDCRTCHGLSLQGAAEGAGIACDDCHQDEWEETCTFCHGGVDGQSGAPPEDIDDNADPSSISFPAHNAHVQRTIHSPWECSECHVKPESALDPGHFFDDATPGVAEVGFATATLSPDGVYGGNGGCSNLYCHSSGQQGATGEVAASASTSCNLCHPDWTSSEGQLDTMSGEHEKHVGEGVSCSECHPNVDASGAITGPAFHVDGQRQTAFPAAMTVTGAGVNRTCLGTCHEHDHEAGDDDTW